MIERDTDPPVGPAELRPARLRALVSLLADENPNVYGPAMEHLEKIGGRANDVLVEAAVRSNDARVRVRARRVLSETRREGMIDEWSERCANDSLDLETGAILISCVEYPHRSRADILRPIGEYGDILRRRLAESRTTDAAVRRTVEFLSGQLGFGGQDSVDHDDPENSFLHRVLEQKRGLPILLSTIYLLVAQRAGLELLGVGMPYHFILKFASSSEATFLDPFHDGRILTRDDCRQFLETRQIRFRETYLRTVTDREMLSRMLGNLLRVYHASDDQRRLRRVLRMLRALER